MGEDPLPSLEKFRVSLRGFGKSKKRNILILTILVLTASLFFSVFFNASALAKKSYPSVEKADIDSLDPMARIGLGMQDKNKTEDKKLCEFVTDKDGASKELLAAESSYRNVVAGYPMEAMVPALAKKDKEVAAFLIGIAKKESDWGKHTPKKNGRECYNFWGFKGGYNLTQDGYSCFDSPEQAVDMVGQRIADLIAKKVDTPARMVVWKCGSTCAGHDPIAVKKWISDVSLYYYRLES